MKSYMVSVVFINHGRHGLKIWNAYGIVLGDSEKNAVDRFVDSKASEAVTGGWVVHMKGATIIE